MLKAAIFATLLVLVASQQYTPYNNVPINPVFPQGQEYSNNYYGQPQGTYPFYRILRPFKQFPFISLVNNENKPLGYIYWPESEAVIQQQQNFLPVRDYYGNLLGYYSWNQYTPGEQFQPQILDKSVISQLGQFGFIYNQQTQDKFGFLVVKNPYVFHYNENGVLRPTSFQNNLSFDYPLPYNFIPTNYNNQYQYPIQYIYGQQYLRPTYNPNYQSLSNYDQNIPTY
ncbi:uncharacterized protein [Halyomorpha halys]|uniref:uncharacterized protein n=1 Tax=Halyomorpha halys TaxID=286706 RepID=UPI0006D528E1|nr:uncharacterized protein LOC106689964 [Halyomorpha halys]